MSPRGPICLRCVMLTLSGHAEFLKSFLFYCLLDLCCALWLSVFCMFSYIVCVVCFTV